MVDEMVVWFNLFKRDKLSVFAQNRGLFTLDWLKIRPNFNYQKLAQFIIDLRPSRSNKIIIHSKK